MKRVQFCYRNRPDPPGRSGCDIGHKVRAAGRELDCADFNLRRKGGDSIVVVRNRAGAVRRCMQFTLVCTVWASGFSLSNKRFVARFAPFGRSYRDFTYAHPVFSLIAKLLGRHDYLIALLEADPVAMRS